MPLSDYFLTPAGLAALAAAVPLLLLYLLQPDPERLEIPTARFLLGDPEGESHNRVVETLRRNVLLLVQLLAIVLIALALASPYVTVAERTTIEEAVVVVDTSASMQTSAGGATRFDRAIERAGRAVADTTTVVTTAPATRTALRRGTPAEAERTLDSLDATDAPGDTGDAIVQAARIAGEDARLVVVSDFAGEGWRGAVETARARGLRVDLVQFAGGGADNAGIVGYSFADGEVTARVKNTGDRQATRTLSLGGARERLSLSPGDVGRATFEVPADGGRLRLSPGDSFPVDDAVPIATPADATVEVLVLTNDENRYLTTALSLIDGVEPTVRNPPTTIGRDYDVIVLSNVDPDRLLPGNVRTARETLKRGGGVVIQAQPGIGRVGYGALLPIQPSGIGNGTVVETGDDPLVADISFSPPERYVSGELRARGGRALVRAGDGSPLIATAAGGRVLYYGFIEDASGFKYNYRYPVFWKRAVYRLAGRGTLPELNRRTGETWRLPAERAVETPRGTRTARTVVLDAVGVYGSGERRVAAALADPAESAVSAEPIEASAGPAAGGAEPRRVPRNLSHLVAAGALLVVLLELGLLRYRGDL